MKGPSDRTKIVVRHLPPEFSQSQLLEQIDGAYSGRYNWVSFHPGKYSLKHPSYSRAYIDFKNPEDVIEFSLFFNGHVFVNEKGSQYRTIVEYAPSQHVPRQSSKKNGREGTIFKDSEYLEFLEFIAKPIENLPSAEIQLERREAERAGAPKEPPVVTPLMDFVRKKRDAKSESRRSLSNGKLSRKAVGAFARNSSPASSRRGSDKRKTSSTMRYVLRDAAKNSSGKDKSAYILVAKKNDQRISDKSATSNAASRTDTFVENSGVPMITNTRKKVLLLKDKEREICDLQNVMSSTKNLTGSLKQTQRCEGSGRIIRTILLNKDSRRNQSSLIQSEPQVQGLKLEDKQPPRLPHSQLHLKDTNGAPENEGNRNDIHGFFSEKHEKRTRNKEEPERGVWNLRRSDGLCASDKSLSSSAPHPTQSSLDSFEGSHRQVGRRGPIHGAKDLYGSLFNNEMKIKRGGPTAYGSLEKQVWLQKSSSGS